MSLASMPMPSVSISPWLPVVTSTVGAAGLDVADGVHVLMADSPGDAARAASVLQFCMPHQVGAGEGRLTVNYTMFEASTVPAGWVARGRDCDLVVVPTRSSLEAWLASGYPRGKLRVCPLGVDTGRFGPASEAMPLSAQGGRPVSDYRVRVLNVSDSMPRKNLAGLVRTWISATSAGDDAILIVKVGPATRQATSALFRRPAIMEQKLGKRRDQAAPILFVNRLLTTRRCQGCTPPPPTTGACPTARAGISP
jgi:glycosyltransferase involved in cell wall biosynthesis